MAGGRLQLDRRVADSEFLEELFSERFQESVPLADRHIVDQNFAGQEVQVGPFGPEMKVVDVSDRRGGADRFGDRVRVDPRRRPLQQNPIRFFEDAESSEENHRADADADQRVDCKPSRRGDQGAADRQWFSSDAISIGRP